MYKQNLNFSDIFFMYSRKSLFQNQSTNSRLLNQQLVKFSFAGEYTSNPTEKFQSNLKSIYLLELLLFFFNTLTTIILDKNYIIVIANYE